MYNLSTIKTYYEENGCLTSSLRKELAHALARYFIHFNIFVSRSDFPVITGLIKKEFSEEDEEYYYKPPCEEHKDPRGKLYYRYINQTGNWREKLNGIYKNNVSKNKKKESENPGK